jgi:hypothetical protein
MPKLFTLALVPIVLMLVTAAPRHTRQHCRSSDSAQGLLTFGIDNY